MLSLRWPRRSGASHLKIHVHEYERSSAAGRIAGEMRALSYHKLSCILKSKRHGCRFGGWRTPAQVTLQPQLLVRDTGVAPMITTC